MKLNQAATILLASIVQLTSTKALEVIKSENPTGGHIVSFIEGFLKPQHDELIAMDAKDKILQVIQGGDFAASSHGEVEYIYEDGFAAKLDDAGLMNVLNSTDVMAVEEDGYVELDQVRSWGLDRIDDEKLPLDRSYNPAFGNNGAGVTAYVIDTGILASHVEFGGRATQEYNSVSGDPNQDCNGHGTHVAGTIGSTQYGVANKVKLVGVKVLSCQGRGTWSGVIAGINWVKANAKKPATANMSLGGGKSLAVNNAVNALVASGVTTVVAAGNSNRDACGYSPASQPNAITVASTTSTDYRSSFSNWGSCVDIFAPGSSIAAPWIGSNTAIRTISGTSMASPHVCGAVALYLGRDRSLSVSAVTSKLLGDSIINRVSNVGSRTPNRMLFVGQRTGSGFGTPSLWIRNYAYGAGGWRVEKHPRVLADVNGDGKADIVGFGHAGVYVSLSTGSGLGTPSMWIRNYAYGNGWRVEKHPRVLADVNGDGKADIVGFGHAGTYVSLSTGSGFGTPSLWIRNYGYGNGWRVENHPRVLADVNGDGKADIVGFGHSGTYVSLSTGSGFGTPSMWIRNYAYGNGWRVEYYPRVSADVNGDGKADIVGFGYAGTYVSLSQA
jgi:subtilisin family serine protease